ncbi:protein SPMIP7 [Limanda limanda]|uniref:protein SPMIP7 n=1 Tax=Limanda limanda TaxID=27771 RepID=UPI0029C73BFE|nr:protein SPMIP7 [Limanda limanda]
MSAVWDPFKPFPAEQHVIRRLNYSLYGTGGRNGPAREPGRANSPFDRFHAPAERVTRAPSRYDVPLLDPCTGQLSAGAEVELGVKGRPKFIDFHHVASALWVPPGFRERARTAPNPPAVCVDLSENNDWNYRRIPDTARTKGSATADKVQPTHLRLTDEHTGPQDDISSDVRLWTDPVGVRRFKYTSTTHRTYEKVGWETKFPRFLNAPETSLMSKADPVSERPSSRRYNSRPQLWQSIGAEWSRQQLRSRYDAKKPISFCSGCPRSGQIPLYTGTIGSKNMDNIDNMDETFQPLTLKRSIVPRYTPTAGRTTIPGYTGRATYADGGADAALPVPAPARSSGVLSVSEAAVSLKGTVSLGPGRAPAWLDTSAFTDSAGSHHSPSIPSWWPQESHPSCSLVIPARVRGLQPPNV